MFINFFLRKRNSMQYLYFCILFLIPTFSFAQQEVDKYIDIELQKKTNVEKFSYTIGSYYVAQWEKILPNINLIRRLTEHAGIIKIDNKNAYNEISKLARIDAANNAWKFSPALEKRNKNNETVHHYILSASSVDSLLYVLKSRVKNLIVEKVDKASNSIVVQCSHKFVLEKIISFHEIIFIDEYILPKTEISIIGYNRSFHGINVLDYTIPTANGKNIVVGVKENNVEVNDLDIYKRVVSSTIAATKVEEHATVISSIIGGAGNSFYDGRGMANAAKFFSSTFSNLFADDAAILNTNKVTVQNHSYGTIPQQFYGAEALSYDVQTWQNKNLLHVFSAGNKGLSFAPDGVYKNIPTYANVTGNFKMAKNIITVGAVDVAGNVAMESSAGPIYDGRLAPQLVALGPNGTSDAAAIVTGTIAVMQQVYADSNSQVLPTASLIKAIMFNTADDVYKTGIDYKTGYGLVNSFAAVRALQQKKYDVSTIIQNQVWTKNIIVPANAAQLKITLSYADSNAAVNNNKAIINDVDIELQEISTGFIYKPWVLSTFANADSLAKLPIRKRDSLNTAEQISIALPNAGSYQIKVLGTNIVNTSLPFCIAYKVDTLNTFSFINPQHASDVNRAENEILNIKWKTFVADTNQLGNLFISYNNGLNWELIKQSLKVYTNKYAWQIKDTNSTAVLKMETMFGTFLSKSFIISKVIRPNVDFVCADSFRLSWNKHVYASSYKIYSLIDSAFLKPILTVIDTFNVFKRSTYPSLVYAVEPMLSNSLPAARSIALNIELQGIKCFYKTLNYNLLDGNKLDLILELSVAGYVDSIFFEKLSSVGQFQKNYGSVKVMGNNLIYTQLVNELENGTTYFRAKLLLKNGSIVYTDIISVLTSGKQSIIFYPNPVSKTGMLNFMLQQGLSPNSRLQFFDITGRLIKSYATLPTKIDLSTFSSGIFVYKLYDVNNKKLETGKFVVLP
jgi:Subtilase family/Secretion system C-terminal sorting domain